jgi:hypothetical protein
VGNIFTEWNTATTPAVVIFSMAASTKAEKLAFPTISIGVNYLFADNFCQK